MSKVFWIAMKARICLMRMVKKHGKTSEERQRRKIRLALQASNTFVITSSEKKAKKVLF